MKLNKRQMAKAFEVSTQAIDYWIFKGLPYTPGAPGVPAVFVWDEVEDYLIRYGRFGNHNPHDIVEAAYHRAVAILEDGRTRKRGFFA